MSETIKFMPQEVDDVTIAFPANIMHLLPKMEEIPEEFHHRNTKWNRFIDDLFYGKVPSNTVIHEVDGVDPVLAGRHIRAILGSFEPKHEHKSAGCAYLCSLWFTSIDGYED